MHRKHQIIIAGAGGIAQAAGLMLAELSEVVPDLMILNRSLEHANEMAAWIREATSGNISIQCFELTENGLPEKLKAALEKSDILLDCLPGSLAPKMGQLAKDFHLHYANLTEYVAETESLKKLAADAGTGFLLQTGLAPGYINVLAHKLFQDFCEDFNVEKVDRLEMKVGALGLNAVAPHFYGFTWSPVGVATEYLKPAVTLRDYNLRNLPALSSRKKIIIDGFPYEEALTSGGAADLPIALTGLVNNLDYKTLRHPGHYEWVERQIENLGPDKEEVVHLQERMQAAIPHLEDDQVILYAAVEGQDKKNMLRRREISKKILPTRIGKTRLRAIQTTTAAPLLQSAMLLLENNAKGVILQSQIEPTKFLEGHFIKTVYGEMGIDS